MDSFTNLFSTQNLGQLILTILFIIYLIMGYNLPDTLAELINTLVGKLIVVAIFLSLFAFANPILGILGLLVAFNLIRNSGISTGTTAINQFLPSETKKNKELTAFNQFSYTLEQEIVKKMAPLNKIGFVENQSDFKPILENLYDASPIN